MNDFSSLMAGAAQSVVTVGLIASAGAYACWRGILTPSTVKQLDKLVQELLIPAIVFYKVHLAP
jgi:predicted permease